MIWFAANIAKIETKEPAFLVHRASQPMTFAGFDDGRLFGVIGMARVKPAKFVICRIWHPVISTFRCGFKPR